MLGHALPKHRIRFNLSFTLFVPTNNLASRGMGRPSFFSPALFSLYIYIQSIMVSTELQSNDAIVLIQHYAKKENIKRNKDFFQFVACYIFFRRYCRYCERDSSFSLADHQQCIQYVRPTLQMGHSSNVQQVALRALNFQLTLMGFTRNKNCKCCSVSLIVIILVIVVVIGIVFLHGFCCCCQNASQ